MSAPSRRNFLKSGITDSAGAMLVSSRCSHSQNKMKSSDKKRSSLKTSTGNIKISDASSQFESEPLLQPFGFKGGYLSELWQTVSYLKAESGMHSIGLGTQSVLWSDSSVFKKNSEAGGNALMFSLTEYALQILKNVSFTSPVDIIDSLYKEVYEYGKSVTCNPGLRKTFALNALVPVDNALWLLYAKENNITRFDELIPDKHKAAFMRKHGKLAAIPLISYNVTPEEIKKEADSGCFFMKIKIGQPGTQQEMLEKDKQRLSDIHSVLKNIYTPYTHNGKLPYYFDANGRYKSGETFLRFLDYADKINAMEHIVMVEEPFPEEMEIDVSDFPVRLAADESAHTDTDAVERIQMGYRAIALKPIAKTLSMTMKIAMAATERNIPCFCADLTVNPVLVEWNKNVAARLNSFPGLDNLGLVESNGHQNYKNWEAMKKYFPRNDASWVNVQKGFYITGDEYFNCGGGIFDPVPHYEKMFENK